MENYLKVDDGVELLYRKDLVENPKGVILINHGFAEHFSRYDYVANVFNRAGFNVYRYDLRGHGRSKSQLGHIDKFSDFIEDADKMVNLIEDEYNNLPIFMLGHSMGGLITALYGIKYKNKLKGQIFSGAALGYLPAVRGLKKYIFPLADTIFGKMKIKNPIDNSLCSVKEVFESYVSDPLVLKEASLHFFVEFLTKAIIDLNHGIEEYNYPCLLTHGGDDKIVPKELSKSFYNRISSVDKEIKIYDGLYHEILNEDIKDQILEDMVHWIEKRLD